MHARMLLVKSGILQNVFAKSTLIQIGINFGIWI
jgi:hypothetical protein